MLIPHTSGEGVKNNAFSSLGDVLIQTQVKPSDWGSKPQPELTLIRGWRTRLSIQVPHLDPESSISHCGPYFSGCRGSCALQESQSISTVSELRDHPDEGGTPKKPRTPNHSIVVV